MTHNIIKIVSYFMNNVIHKLEFNTKTSDGNTYKLGEWKIQS